MARVMSGTGRTSRLANRKKEAKSSGSSKRRGERQKQPNVHAIQGRGMKKQNNQKSGARAQAKG